MKTTMKFMVTGVLFTLSMSCLAAPRCTQCNHKNRHNTVFCCKHSHHTSHKHCIACDKAKGHDRCSHIAPDKGHKPNKAIINKGGKVLPGRR